MREIRVWKKTKEIFEIFKKMYMEYKGIIGISGLIFYKIVLDLVYVKIMSGAYTYQGFYKEFSWIRFLIGYLTVLCMIPLILKIFHQRQNSSIIVVGISLFYGIPMTTMFSFFGFDAFFYLSFLIFWFLILVLQIKIPVLYFEYPKVRGIHKIADVMIVFSIFFVIFMSGKYTGFRFTLDIINVYGIRAEAAGYEVSLIEGYIFSMISVAIPVFCLYTLENKKYLFSMMLIISQLFIFSFSGQKANMLILGISLIGYFIYKEEEIYLFPGLFSLLGIPIFAEYVLTGKTYILALTYNRNMFLPPKISYEIYQFFQSHPIDIYRQSILGKLGFESPYIRSLDRMIGEHYYGQFNNANNGLLGDVYANLGVIGILVLPVILIVCFRVLDSVTQNINKRITVGVCIYYAMIFTNGLWSTNLLTHGFLLICGIFYFYPRVIKEKQAKGKRKWREFLKMSYLKQ